MSYTDDRDDLAELLGIDPKPKTGYSEEIQETKATPKPSQAPQQKVTKTPAAPAKPAAQPTGTPAPRRETLPQPRQSTRAEVEGGRPVKKRQPNADVPPPLEKKRTPPSEPHRVVEDEEISSYDSSAPDLSMLDFDDLDATPLRQKAKSTARPPVKRQAAPAPVKQQPSGMPPARTAAPAPAARKENPAVAAPRSQPVATPATAQAAPTQTPSSGDSPFADGRGKPTSDKLLLDTHGLIKIYDGRTVVNGVDINVRPGEIVGLLGPNGAGKTTSFYMIVGLVPPNGGQVLFNGEDVTKEPMYQRARLGMGYLPQEESIFRKLTVEENIMAVMETIPISKKERKERCDELLERFSITHIRKNVALTCSGGEKRRLTIARSLVTEPSLLMLDEPFSGVDPIAVNEIQTIVEDLRKSGLAILITDHNARQTLELVDRAYLIYEGKVLREGSRDFLINDPVSRELYLGDRFTM